MREAPAVPTVQPNGKPDLTAAACDTLATLMVDISDGELENKTGKETRGHRAHSKTEETCMFAVNDRLAQMVIDGLVSMGVNNPCSFIAHWSNKRFHAIANFVEGCEYVGLKCAWGEDQIKAFMDYLYDKHYAVSTLDAQWSTLRLVGKTISKTIPRTGSGLSVC